MPVFEYKCNDCGTKFEELVIRSDEQVNCPSCNSANATKQLSTFAASVSGSGSAMPCGAPSASSCGSGGFS